MFINTITHFFNEAFNISTKVKVQNLHAFRTLLDIGKRFITKIPPLLKLPSVSSVKINQSASEQLATTIISFF